MIDKIIEKKKEEIQRLKTELPLKNLINQIKDIPREGLFKKALRKEADVAIIAELKKASASEGLLRDKFDPLEIAEIYELEGIDAISVLTEKNFFQGDLDYIRLLKKNISLPLLQKDFFIDEYQIYYSAYLGADAILLISSILKEEEISDFIFLAKKFNLDVLVEVHTEADLKKVLPFNPAIIGINNRDLKTFKVNLNNTLDLISLIPESKEDIIIVSESGIESQEDIITLKEVGVDAVLIGETFMKSDDIRKKIREIKGLS